MGNKYLGVLFFLLFYTTSISAVPVCTDIFQDPPVGNHHPNGLVPPDGILDQPLKDLYCERSTCWEDFTAYTTYFPPGDFDYDDGTFKKTRLTTGGVTTRLYFNTLKLTNAKLNLDRFPENLIIYVSGSLTIAGKTEINGLIYVAGSVHVSGQAKINGGLASGGSLAITGNNSSVTVDPIAIDYANFGGMCTDVPPAPTIDHYRIEFSANALACKAQPITIRACENSSCTTELSSVADVQLTKSGVAQPQDSFTGSTTRNLWHTSGGQVQLGLTNTSPSSGFRCYIDGNLVSNSACQLTYNTAGFIFDVPDKLANKPVAGIEISAVKQGDVATQCVPTFASVNKSVSFWSDYVNPNEIDRPASLPISVNGSDVGLTLATAETVNLSFNATGKATLEVNYADAGKVQLNARYTGSVGADDEGLVVDGSDTFISAPVGLCITPENICSDEGHTCPVFKKTGEDFTLDIQAKAWQSDTDSDICVGNGNTPNYVQSDIALGSELVAPKPGADASVKASSYNHKASANSSNTVNQAVDEVGVFKFTANPPASYLGSAFNLPEATSDSVGRFIPHAFKLTAHSVIPACNHLTDSFTYMDQPFSSSITAEAINHLGVKTVNYRDGFAKARLAFVAENKNLGVELSSRVGGLAINPNWDGTSFALAWNQGQVSATNDIKFARLATGIADGPFESLMIGAKLNDGDGERSLVASPDMNAATSTDCTVGSLCNAKAMTPSMRMRQGRIVAENTYGPETETLRMPVTAQYWNGSAWVTSSSDSCSVLAAQTLPEPYTNVPALGYNYAGLPTGDQRINRTLGGGSFINGEFTLLWQALSSSDPLYRGQVTAPIIVPDWLTWYWNWNGGAPTDLVDPRASAYFGTYRGHDRIIYWREVN